MYQNNFIYFLKFIYDISISKQFKNKKNNFKQKNILKFLKRPFLLQKQTCTKE
jgi:hypothetical protein